MATQTPTVLRPDSKQRSRAYKTENASQFLLQSSPSRVPPYFFFPRGPPSPLRASSRPVWHVVGVWPSFELQCYREVGFSSKPNSGSASASASVEHAIEAVPSLPSGSLGVEAASAFRVPSNLSKHPACRVCCALPCQMVRWVVVSALLLPCLSAEEGGVLVSHAASSAFCLQPVRFLPSNTSALLSVQMTRMIARKAY